MDITNNLPDELQCYCLNGQVKLQNEVQYNCLISPEPLTLSRKAHRGDAWRIDEAVGSMDLHAKKKQREISRCGMDLRTSDGELGMASDLDGFMLAVILAALCNSAPRRRYSARTPAAARPPATAALQHAVAAAPRAACRHRRPALCGRRVVGRGGAAREG
jgi:hypothetical protein